MSKLHSLGKNTQSYKDNLSLGVTMNFSGKVHLISFLLRILAFSAAGRYAELFCCLHGISVLIDCHLVFLAHDLTATGIYERKINKARQFTDALKKLLSWCQWQSLIRKRET